jgi:hypothetical protein
MEYIRKESDSAAAISNPADRNIIKDFFKKIGELNQIQKIKMIYSYFTGKKPDPLITEDKVLNRILYEINFGQKIKETQEALKNQKKFKWPWKVKQEMKNSKKFKEQILVFYLNVKGELEYPKLYPVYGGNMIIIRNKPYLLDPTAVITFDKYKCMVIREIDRRPVCNKDYRDVKARGDSTESDELLIKATLKAMIGPQKAPVNKNWIIAAVVIIAIVGGLIWLMTKK